MPTTCNPAEMTYHDVEKMIDKIVHLWRRKMGCGWDDLLLDEDLEAEARRLYAKAYKTWPGPETYRFTTWVWRTIWWGLIGIKRAATRQGRLRPGERLGLPDENGERDWGSVMAARERFDARRLLSDLGEDAAVVVRTVLETPGEVFNAARPRASRRCLVRLLLDLGWSASRIAATFREVKEILT